MKPVLQTLAILFFGGLIIITTSIGVNKYKEPDVVEKITEKKIILPDCPQNYISYQELVEKGQMVELVNNAQSYSSNGKFINPLNVTVTRTGTAEIVCGYLYINARVDGRKLDEKYESIYINPQGFGGHILRTRGITFNSKISNVSEVLLPLNAVSYLPNLPYNPNARDFLVADWVKLLGAGNKLSVNIALSTNDSRGTINSIQIVYKCWDWNTEKESNECQLGIEQ